MKKHLLRRGFAGFLILIMVISMFPLEALAEAAETDDHEHCEVCGQHECICEPVELCDVCGNEVCTCEPEQEEHDHEHCAICGECPCVCVPADDNAYMDPVVEDTGAEPEFSDAYLEVQAMIDEVVDYYLVYYGFVMPEGDMTEEERAAARAQVNDIVLNSMDANERENALMSIREVEYVLEAYVESGELSEAEVEELAAANEVFVWFVEDVDSVSVAPSMLVETATLSIDGNGGAISIYANRGSFSTSGSGATTSVTHTNKISGMSWGTSYTFYIYNRSSTKATLTYSYKTTSGYDDEMNFSGSGTVLAPGEYVTMTANSTCWSGQTDTVVFNNFVLTPYEGTANVTLNYDSTIGTVSDKNGVVASGTTGTVSASTGITATANSGATFLGWVNAADGSILTTSATYVPDADATISVKAAFASATTNAWFMIGKYSTSWGTTTFSAANYFFDNLKDAVTACSAHSCTTIIPVADGTLPAGDYTIPSGITLLIPYESGNILSTTEPKYSNTAPSNQRAYRTLNMASGVNLTIASGGAMNVNAAVFAANGAAAGAGTPISTYGYVKMASGSSITVAKDGKLYAYGYIGGSGSVTAESGATLYEVFQFEDFRGGDQTSQLTQGQKQYGVFPMSAYTVQNIMVPLTINHGATEYAFACMNMSSISAGTTIKFISDSDSMFVLSSGSVTKQYDYATDRLVVTANSGEMSISNISMSISTIISTVSLNSIEYDLPINGNMTIRIKTGSTITLNQDICLLPGAEVYVESGAKCILSDGCNLFVFDEDQWPKTTGSAYVNDSNVPMMATYFVPERQYTRTVNNLKDVYFEVAGTVQIGGNVYTTGTDTTGGAAITGVEGATITMPVAASDVVHYQMIQNATPANSTFHRFTTTPDAANENDRPMTSAKLKNGDESYTCTNKTNNGLVTTTYTYTNGRWVCGVPGEVGDQHTYDHDGDGTDDIIEEVAPTCTKQGEYVYVCVACGYEKRTPGAAQTGHTEVIDAAVTPTCTATGLTEGYHCSVCGTVTVAQEVIPALAHTWGDATCTAPKTCSVCGTTEGEALGHTWVDATCTTPKTCSVCGATEGETLDHSFNTDVTAPTCTQKGYTTYTCSHCGASYVDDYVDPIGHNWNDATCTAPTTCSVCGATDGEALGHSYDDGVVTAEPTCTETGVKTYTCRTCSDTYTAAIPATGHKGVHVEAKEATCTEDGWYEYWKCEDCGLLFSDSACTQAIDSIPNASATGHSYTSVVTAPTCTEDGYTTHTCAGCGDSYTDSEVAATGHTWGAGNETTKPTCTEEGVKTFRCQNEGCTASKTETVAALRHSFTNYVSDGNATCLVDGTKTADCDHSCGETNTVADTGSALGHSFTNYVSDGNATCLVDGTKTAKCDRCDVTDTVTDEGSALGHAYNAVVTAPTCTAQGYTTYTCSRCDDSYVDDYTNATDHSHDAVVTAPTCTEKGYTTYTCHCGDSYVADFVDEKGHDYKVTETITSATCTESGKEKIVCQNCGDVQEQVIDAKGHTPGADATCTTAQTCTVCGTEIVGALSHSYGERVVTAPTCTAQGYTTYTCSRCGTSYVDDYVDATGHTEVTDAAVAATCTATGLTEGKHCSVCNAVLVAQTVVDALGHDYDYENATYDWSTDLSRCTATATCRNSCGVPVTETVDTSWAITQNPTCTEEGVKTYTAEFGNANFTDKTKPVSVEANGHSLVNTPAQSASCEADGNVEYWTCSVCGKLFLDANSEIETTAKDVVIPKTGHSYSLIGFEWTNNNLTCTATGTCGNKGCEHPVVTEIVHLENKDITISKAATCLEKGDTTYTATFISDWIPKDQRVQTEVTVGNVAKDSQNHVKPGEFTYSDNGDGTHNKNYACCGALVSHENHSYTNGECLCDAVQSFTISWINGGSTKTTTVVYGETPEAPFAAADLVKAPVKACHYVFSGWSTELDGTAVTVEGAKADVTYYAVFASENHDNSADCEVCSVCNFEGVAEHNANLATCDTPATCSVCHKELEPAMGHQYSWNATLSYWVHEEGRHYYVAVASCNREGGCTSTDTYLLDGQEISRVDADCLNDGKVIYKAEGTKAEWKATISDEDEVTISALGHSLTETSAKASTCVEQGNNAYWTCSRCGKVYADAEATQITSVEAQMRPLAHHTWNSGEETKAPGCETKGETTYTCLIDGCGATYTVDIPAINHNYEGGIVTYEWNADNTSCTAFRACTNDGCSVKEEAFSVNFTSAVTTPAKCEEAGERTHTATFGVEWAAPQTTTSSIPATDHDYGEAVCIWKLVEGKWICTATRTCRNDAAHVETATAVVTKERTKDPTCTEKGKTTYTATFTEIWASAEPHVVADIDALGHVYGTTNYAWSADGKACIATHICTVEGCNDATADHMESVVAKITAEVTKAHSCTTMGETTYTATFDGVTWAETKTKTLEDIPAAHTWVHAEETPATCTADGETSGSVCTACDAEQDRSVIPALGHDWTNWEPNGNGTHTRSCKRCDKTETADCTGGEATCEAEAICEVCHTEYGTELGHKYEGAVVSYSWNLENGIWVCTAERACLNDGTHKETATAQVTGSQTKEPGCTTMGETTYTATFTVGWAGQDTKVVVDIPASGHTYTAMNAAAAYLKSEATCSSQAVYYMSCACGASSEGTVNESTFAYGEVRVHSWSDWTSTGNDTHIRTCDYDDCRKTETVACSGGTATCTEKAVCTVCNAEYGEVLNHSWSTEVSYDWSFDAETGVWTCTATRTCVRDASHTETAAGSISSEITTPATCKVMGWTTYTATFTETWAITKVESKQDVALAEHTPDSGKITKSPFYNKEGERTFYCTVCEEVCGTEIIPATGVVNISVLGDSITAFENYSNGTAAQTANSTLAGGRVWFPMSGKDSEGNAIDTVGEIQEAGQIWIYKAAAELGANILVNNSWSGSAVQFYQYGAPGMWEDRCVQLHDNMGENSGQEPDIIVVYMGTNDFKHVEGIAGMPPLDANGQKIEVTIDTLGTYEAVKFNELITENDDGTFTYKAPITTMEAFAISFHKMQQRYPNSELYVMNILPFKANKDQPTAFNEDIRQMADHFGATLVDLEKVGLEADAKSFEYLMEDWLHPNLKGMEMLSNAFVTAVRGSNLVSFDLDGVVSLEGTSRTAPVGESFESSLKLKDQSLTMEVNITMAGVDITDSCYTEEADTKLGGKIGKISIANVTGPITITATSHKHSYSSVGTAPTCAESGYTTYTCTCGYSYRGNETPAAGHSYTTKASDVLVSDATCTSAAVYYVQCDNCDNVSETKTVFVGDPLPHTYNNNEASATLARTATCTLPALYYVKCDNCDAVNTSRTVSVGNSNGHTYGTTSYSWSYDATEQKWICTAEHICTVGTCTEAEVGHKETETVTATGQQTKAPDCTEKGETTYIAVFTVDWADRETKVVEDIAANGHTYSETTYTWSEDGKACTATHICTVAGCDTTAEGHSETTTAQVLGRLTTAPDCTNMGVTTYTAHFNVNWAVQKTATRTDVSALGHDEVAHDAKEETCTGIGWEAYVTCSRCDYSTYVEIPATGHSHETVVTDPTCTEPGYTTYTCHCGDSYVADYVDAPGHNYEDVVTDPICTEKGYTTHTCTVCGNSYKDSYVDAPGHDYEDVVTDPTCMEKGYTTHTCIVCGNSYKDSYVDTPGHDYEDVVTDPTCTEKGYTTHTCTVCGDTYKDTYVAATGHSYESVVTAATCTEKGYTTYTCANCGNSYITNYVNATGHSWNTTQYRWEDDFSVCYASRTCKKNASHVETESTVEISYTDIDSSCYEQGTRTYTATFDAEGPFGTTSKEEKLPLVDHSYGEGVVTAPTCTERGYTTYTCPVCPTGANGHTKVEDFVAASGHSYEAAVTAPTCTAGGYTTNTCANCGDRYTDNPVAATGHSHEAVVTDPTCVTKGYTTYTCHCGDSYVADTVDALGHAYESVVTGPTCTERGYTTHTCTVCAEGTSGHTKVDSYIAATGHSGQLTAKVSATCTEPGTKAYWTCTVCGEVFCDAGCTVKVEDFDTWVEIPATGHQNVTAVEEAEAKCEASGLVAYWHCAECGTYFSAFNSSEDCTEIVDFSVWSSETGEGYIPATGHRNVVKTEEEPAECLAAGTKAYWTCEDCGTRFSDEACETKVTSFDTWVVIPATGHSKQVDKAVAPTCTETGLTEGGSCANCGMVIIPQIVIAAKGHNEVIDVKVAANCHKTGLTEGAHCSVCGEVFVAQEEIPMTEHNWGSGLLTTPNTCEEDGERTFTCSICRDTKTEVEPALGHILEYVEAKKPTYSGVGWEAYERCTRFECGYSTYRQIPMLDRSEISDYETFMTYLQILEEYANDYVEENPGKDPAMLVIKYIRTGVDRYNSGSWNIMAGYEDTGFADYVKKTEDAYNSALENVDDMIQVTSLKNINNFYLPNGDLADIGHMFGTLDISYTNFNSINHADVAGWTGDLVDLLSLADQFGVSGTQEEMMEEIESTYFLKDESTFPEKPNEGSFNQTDFNGDLDGFYVMEQLRKGDYEEGKLYNILNEYFTTDLTLEDRADYLLKNRLGGATSRSDIRDAVYSAYTQNQVIGTLEGTREFNTNDLTALRKACCYVFADYLCKLAGDYVEESDNIYFDVFSTEKSTLAPGITQEINKAYTADDKQIVYYIATADVNSPYVDVYANYNANDPSQGWAMSRVLDQALAAQERHGDPESEYYIPNYAVVAATNGAGFDMSTGEPGGLLVMEGVEYHAPNANGFFGILTDGSAVIGSTAEYYALKEQGLVKEGIAAFGATLVKDGQIAVSYSEGYTGDRASRTAVGITRTGKVVLMVLDGRQEPVSCGGSMQEIAQIMLEAGCYQAVNLDGGGSTTYVARQEGDDSLSLVSKPSDGYQRSVSTSLIMVSTAPSSTEFDHAALSANPVYLTVGAQTQVTAAGVSPMGNSTEIPEGASWTVADESKGSIDANGLFTAKALGDVTVNLMLDGEIVGSMVLHVVNPTALYFTRDQIDAVYGEAKVLPLKALYNGKEVAFLESDVEFSLSNNNAGAFEGFGFIGDEDSGIKSVTATASLVSDENVKASVIINLFNADEYSFDFNNATGGDRKLSWLREVSNASTTDNTTYTVINREENTVTSYTFGIDMTQIPIPERLADLTYMLPGADLEGANAWTFLMQLAERISPLSEVKPVIHFDPSMEVDYSELTMVCEYFLLDEEKGVSFDEETNTLTLTLNWKDQTQAIDPETANPICIVSGIKLTPKDDAAWDAKERLSIVNDGEISYTIYMRANALYSFSQKPENQEIYGLKDYINPDDSYDKGGYFGDVYQEFEDSYVLDKGMKNGWYYEEIGYAYYANGERYTGVKSVDGYYYDFGTEGINIGQTKYSGVFENDAGLHCVRNGVIITSGWNAFGEVTYHCHEDECAFIADVDDPTTCTKGGRISRYCAHCGTQETSTDFMMPNGHDWDENYVCRICGTVGKNIADAEVNFGKIDNPRTSTTIPKYYYLNGGVRPGTYVTFDGVYALTKSNDNTLNSNGTMRDMYVSWTNNKGIGKAYVEFVGRGDYYGTARLEYHIVPNDVTNLAASDVTADSVTLTWSAALGADYYRLYFLNEDGTRTFIARTENTSYTVTGLSEGETYSFQVASSAISTDGENKVYNCAKWSNTVTINEEQIIPPGGDAGNTPSVPGEPDVPAIPDEPKDVPCDGGENCVSKHFIDVNTDMWYHEAIDYAVENELMNGVSEELFNPNGVASRAMIVTILWRLANEPTTVITDEFYDVALDSWYTEAIRWASANGVVEGYGDNLFGPNDSITREQMVTILWRYVGKPVVSGGLADFVDADAVSDWAKDAMCWAVANGVVNGKGDGILDPKGQATRAEIAQIFKNYFGETSDEPVEAVSFLSVDEMMGLLGAQYYEIAIRF